jgi:pimeloyl-ACP methyl ester carboxylesterase
MAELIPGAELVLMPGTGQFSLWTHPDEFIRIVLAFLKGERVGTPVAATPTV